MRVVIADDSEIARECIKRVLEEQPGVRVVAAVGSAAELFAAVSRHVPDVVTLDLLMPDRSGLSIIRTLRTQAAVVVVSDVAGDSGLATEALAQGAKAFVEKRALGTPLGKHLLLDALTRARSTQAPVPIIAIAGSTGAMPALEEFVGDLTGTHAAVVVLQHLPASRMEDFAAWLGSLGLPCEIAQPGQSPLAGKARVAPGHQHLRIGRNQRFEYDDGPALKGHKPSATVLFDSLLGYPGQVIAVVLSGMGDDGASAIPALVAAGADCVVQEQTSCPVSSMPESARLAAQGRAKILTPRNMGVGIRSLLRGGPRG